MRRSVLVLHPTWPRPDTCSGDHQLHQLIRLLRRAGHAVVVVGLDRLPEEERGRYAADLVAMGCEVEELFPHAAAHKPWGLELARSKLRAIAERNRCDAALVSFWNVAQEHLLLLRRALPRLRAVVHSWDVWYLREVRGAALAGHLPLLQKFARTRHRELAAYAQADAVLAVTEADAAVLTAGMAAEQAANRLPAALRALPPVITVPHLHPLPADPPPLAARRDVVFVGYFGHQPNVDAALWLGQEIWPRVAEKLPDAHLKIVGGGAPASVQALASDRVEVLGSVADLENLLDGARVSVAPLRYGAGLKGKVSQALAAGLPVVTTPVGAEGIPLENGRHALIAATVEDLAAAVVRLYTDAEQWTRQAAAGRALVAACYGEAPAAAPLFQALFGKLPAAGELPALPADIKALNSLCNGFDWQDERRSLPQALACFREAESLDPMLGVAPLAMAALELERGRPDLARDPWQRAQRLAPRALGVLAVGAELMAREGHTAAAAKAVETVLALSPEHPRAMRLRGELAMATGQVERAAELLKEAARTHPSDFRVHRAFARLALGTGNTELALTLLEHQWDYTRQVGYNAEEEQLRRELVQITESLAPGGERLPATLGCPPENGWILPAVPGTAAPTPQETSPEGKPSVSIIIPVLDRLDLTRACLEALRRHTPAGQVELILVDNGSHDGTVEFLRAEEAAGRLTALFNAENLGFARACNAGAAVARADALLFLNNDTEVRPCWLEPLLATLAGDPQVGAVGSKLLFPDGTIQHAGVIVADDRQLPDPLVARHIYYRERADLPQANQPREYQALTAACLLVRREAFSAADGFDEGYWNGYEDIDLCFRLREDGWRLVYAPASEVIHHESQSGPARFIKVAENIRRLRGRWLAKVEPDLIIHPDGRLESTPAGAIRPYVPGTEAAAGPGLTSIVVLTRNALSYTRRCVAALQAHTPEQHEVIFVDNGSDDGTLEYLAELVDRHPHYRLVRNERNLGYAAGNNQGLAAARGEQLVLLNNDVVVTEGWLGRLLACARRHQAIGLVGPVTNHISGPQRLPEVGYDPESLEGLDAWARQFAQEHAGQRQVHWRAVGFCLLIKRTVLDRIGGLDERFGRGNFEDDDFCLRARLAGFATVVARDCFVHHYGGRTFAACGIDFVASMEENWRIFREKWGVPDGVGYRDDYDMSPHLQAGFDPARHRCPLPAAPAGAAPGEATDPVTLAERIAEGERLFGAQRWPEAEAVFLEILAQIPENVRVRNDLACTLWQQGRSAEALREGSRALQADPDHRDAAWNLGQFLLALGRETETGELYESYLRLHPQAHEFAEALESLRRPAARAERDG
jgi:GT2 family glycosyltransferase/glycosyltransferase involved in cell wall biosynthesis/Flp pilus assembly protein TadD